MSDFFIKMNPPTTTSQSKKIGTRNGKPIMYDSPKLKAAKAELSFYLRKHAPKKMHTGPVKLTVKWRFPMIKKSKDGQYKHTKPDTDNLQKALKDCMTELGFWRDDALVVSEFVEKRWSSEPGIYIKIEEVAI